MSPKRVYHEIVTKKQVQSSEEIAIMTQTTSGYLELDGGKLYYETAGAGETLVLSHAAFLDSRMFDPQWELLAQHFRVIRYDMRGFGRSSSVEGPLCRRDDLWRLLCHLGVQQAHLIGCSNGGEIILDLALEHPNLPLSLTLVGATPSGFQLEGEPPRHVMEMIEAMQQGDTARANELQIRIWFDGAFREPDEVDGAVRQKALQMNQIPVAANTFFIADTQPVQPLDPCALTRLEVVGCPVLIVAGTLDHPEVLRAAEIMAARIPNAQKVLIKNTGHVPSFEQPEAFNQALFTFLGIAPAI